MGRRSKLGEEDIAELVRIVESDRTSTLAEIGAELCRRTGKQVCAQTLVKALRASGIIRQPAHAVVRVKRAVSGSKRYGYTQAHRELAPEQTWPSCLTDAEWELVSDLFDRAGGRGHPPHLSRRLLVDGCCYVVRTGCSWRMLPSHFGRWENVYWTFRRWSAQGKFEQMHDRLRSQWRQRVGRAQAPTEAVLDAQSTRISPQGGVSGFDAGKKVKGRKRQVLVDTLGLLLAVGITAGSVQDRDGAPAVVNDAMKKYPSLQTLYVDSGYAGQCALALTHQYNIRVQVVRHPANKNVGHWVSEQQPDLFTVQADSQGFVPLPKRWVVERTHAWNERSRRLIMHHDRLPEVSKAWVWLAQARMLLRRLIN